MQNIDKLGDYFVAAVVLAVIPLGIVFSGLGLVELLDKLGIDQQPLTDLVSVAVGFVSIIAAVAIIVSAFAILGIVFRVMRAIRAPREMVSRDYSLNADRSAMTSST